MNKFDEITEARNILGVPEQATLKEIKNRYRDLVRKWHPDRCGQDQKKCVEMTAKINTAYAVITEYCENYRFSMAREEVNKYLSREEWWLDRFGDDPLWGKGNKDG